MRGMLGWGWTAMSSIYQVPNSNVSDRIRHKEVRVTLSITMEHGWAEVVAVPGAVGVWPQSADATVDIA